MERWARNVAVEDSIKPINNAMPVNMRLALQELFELLEDYAPSWYTEEHHNRAAAALGQLLSQGAIH